MVYLGLSLVFIASVAATLLLPVEGVIRYAALAPGVAALFGALFQLLRDHASHERQLELREREQLFSLSVTSHMAQIAFDKHAAFCEEYVARVNKGVIELYRDGPSEKATTIVFELSNIRQKHAPWIPPDVLERLKPFEGAIWDVGISSKFLGEAGEVPDRAARVVKMHKTFSQVLGIPLSAAEERPEVRVDHILAHLQDVLGIKELSKLRAAVVRNAMRSLDDHAT